MERDAGRRGLLGLHRGRDRPAIGHGRRAGRRCLGITLGRDVGRRGLLGLHRGGDSPAIAHGRGAGRRLGIALGRDADRWGLLGLHRERDVPAVGHRRGAGHHRLGIALGRDVGRRGLLGRRLVRGGRIAILHGISLLCERFYWGLQKLAQLLGEVGGVLQRDALKEQGLVVEDFGVEL